MAMQGLEDAPDAAAHGDNAARGESIFEAGKIGREDIRSQHCRMLLTQYMLLCQYLLHPLPLLHSCLNSAFRYSGVLRIDTSGRHQLESKIHR
ncbi:Protein of unknown function [Gryllus bimaculatus]|nr:Protein of unknown function [Gryllus bimaculatus]